MARVVLIDDRQGARYAFFVCPGCGHTHGPRVSGGGGPVWGWNGDVDRPTFTPSIMVRGKRQLTDDEYRRLVAGQVVDVPDMTCHSFVTDGRIQFLSDCTHALAGQTVDLSEAEP